MARSLSPTLASVVEDLELDQTVVVTAELLREIVARHQLGTSPKVVAARLRQAGWLLPTGRRGVREFAPGAHAGPIGHGDPLCRCRRHWLPSQVYPPRWRWPLLRHAPASRPGAEAATVDIPRTCCCATCRRSACWGMTTYVEIAAAIVGIGRTAAPGALSALVEEVFQHGPGSGRQRLGGEEALA